MLDSTLTSDRATPMLLLKHQSLYKWKSTLWCVCYKVAQRGGIYRFPGSCHSLGRVSLVEVDGRSSMTCGQTDLVKSVHSLSPPSQCSRQVSRCLAPKWG
jgi:hypothetical protein